MGIIQDWLNQVKKKKEAKKLLADMESILFKDGPRLNYGDLFSEPSIISTLALGYSAGNTQVSPDGEKFLRIAREFMERRDDPSFSIEVRREEEIKHSELRHYCRVGFTPNPDYRSLSSKRLNELDVEAIAEGLVAGRRGEVVRRIDYNDAYRIIDKILSGDRGREYYRVLSEIKKAVCEQCWGAGGDYSSIGQPSSSCGYCGGSGRSEPENVTKSQLDHYSFLDGLVQSLNVFHFKPIRVNGPAPIPDPNNPIFFGVYIKVVYSN